MNCDQCEMLSINGVPCHETGCPNEQAELERTIEEYIDKHGMTHVLTMLANICYEKAEHVQTNWQDRTMASAWRRGAKRIDKAAAFEDWPL